MSNNNPINQSGFILEQRLKEELLNRKLPFHHHPRKNKKVIDFIIGDMYVDCTNQNIGGSVEEKLLHKVWKYWKQYGFDEVYIIRGEHMIGQSVREHLDMYKNTLNVTTHIVTLQQFLDILDDKPTIKSQLDMFFA